MQQMNEVYDYIDFLNQTRATIERLLGVDVRAEEILSSEEKVLEYARSHGAVTRNAGFCSNEK